jgi:hypothetical protein
LFELYAQEETVIHPFNRPGLLAAAGALLIASGCGTILNTQGSPQGGGGGAVTFAITADPAAFSDRQPITVSVWDAEQLAIAASSANCSVSMSSDGQQSVSCPPGVTYRQATPETFTFTRADLAKGLTVVSRTVSVGERYRVAVGGKASDDCNSAGASAEGVASAATTRLADLQVAQTMMACVSPPPVR